MWPDSFGKWGRSRGLGRSLSAWGQGTGACTTVALFLVTKAIGMFPGKCCVPNQFLGQPIAMVTYLKDGQTDLPNHRPIEINKMPHKNNCFKY